MLYLSVDGLEASLEISKFSYFFLGKKKSYYIIVLVPRSLNNEQEK